MSRCTVLATVLSLASAVGAQTTHRTIPPGYLTTEASLARGGLASDFLAHRAYRAQIVTSSLRGMNLTLKELGMRQDGEFYLPLFPKRSWSLVKIHLAAADLDKVKTTFSANYLSSPAAVFSKKVDLPAPGIPNKRPMPWGALGLKFPFTRNYLVDTRRDLLIEIEAAGGKLNGTTWTGVNPYPLEGTTWQHYNGGYSNFYGRGCAYPGRTKHFRSGFTQLAFAKKTGNPAWDDKMATTFYVRNGPATKGVIQAFTTVGTTKTSVQPGKPLPIDLGLCNMLMVETGASIYNVGVTDKDGDWDTPLKFFPYPTFASLVGTDIYTQAAANIGIIRRTPFLSATSKTKIVGQPKNRDQTMVYRVGPTGTTGKMVTIGVPLLRATY